MAQNSTHATSIRVGKFPRFGTSSVATSSGARTRASAWKAMTVRSTSAAPRIEARPTRNPSRRKGSFAPSQPLLRSHGETSHPASAKIDAGTAIRDPTMRPAPTLDMDRPLAPIQGTRSMSHPPRAPTPAPVPRLRTDFFKSVLFVSARMMFATA